MPANPSLLNALARREAAIVSSTPGTTRDVIEVHLDIGGYAVTLADTAGLRQGESEIESEGIRRARASAEKADLKLLVFDGTLWPRRDAATEALNGTGAVSVVNKADLLRADAPETDHVLAISALTGAGIDALLQRLGEEIARRFDQNTSPPLTRARHRSALEECLNHLGRALNGKNGRSARRRCASCRARRWAV